MCIRDRPSGATRAAHYLHVGGLGSLADALLAQAMSNIGDCLLYTSDAADERSSVDLGGRRIIKKKKTDGDNREDAQTTTDNITREPETARHSLRQGAKM